MKLLEYIAPTIAARRAEARLRCISAEKRVELLQSYDAARRDARYSGWRRPKTSANAEIEPSLAWLRATGREFVRNNPHAARAVRGIASHVAGTGVRPRAWLDDIKDADAKDALDAVTRDQWDRFVDNCDPSGQVDFYGQQRLVMRTVAESGEAFRLWVPEAQGSRLFWRCQVIEGDMIDHTISRHLEDGGEIIQGVEFDTVGRRVAYHMFTEHPGDRFSIFSKTETRRVRAEFVDHIYEVLRPGQVRGVSWLTASAAVLRDVSELAEAEVVRKKLEACIAMVIHSAQDDAASPPVFGSPKAGEAPLTDSNGESVEYMKPGMIVQVQPGREVQFNAPPASEGLVEHMKERLQAVAAGIGVPYALMTGNLRDANYSSMRAGELEFGRLVGIWQDDMMIGQSGRPAWRRVMKAAQQDGTIRIGRNIRAKWIKPRRPWADPEKDGRAAVLDVAAGWTSPQDVIYSRGGDPMDVLDNIQNWNKLVAERGISVDPNTGSTVKNE